MAMFSAGSFLVMTMTVMTSTNAGGVGKAWEVSPVPNTDNPSALSSRPRHESSAFEIRSVSGVGRLAPATISQEPSTTKLPIKEMETSAEPMGEATLDTVPKLRVAKELEDLEPVDLFVPPVDHDDPTIEEFFRRSKELSEVDALPSVWQKFRSLGRTGRNHGGHCSVVEELEEPGADESFELIGGSPRVRREAEAEMQKIAGSTSVREGRIGSSDSWSQQPLSVEFRQRSNPEEAAEKEEKSARSTARGIQAPDVDFVTSNRRSFTENRQSRDMAMPPVSGRSFDEIPIHRNTLRDREPETLYTRSLFYPERYRTERDYFVRGPNEPIYQQDRYREVDFDLYGRSRPTPKPKRIIYYATLPEVVRKPVDLRSYPRPYDPSTRSSNAPMAADGYYKRRSGSRDPTGFRYYSYPQGNYENYDLLSKRPSWSDRGYGSYAERMEDSRRREQDLDHASMKDNSRNEEDMLELGHDAKIIEPATSRDRVKLPWPVQIGAEVNVKEHDRITGRKIFGQRDDYNRFRGSDRTDRERQKAGSAGMRN